MKLEPLGELGIPAALVAPAITAGSGFFSKIFGGGDDINYAINFSSQVGVGKNFLQAEANAYHARGTRLWSLVSNKPPKIMGVDIARLEYNAGGKLSDNEILSRLGHTPLSRNIPSTPFIRNNQSIPSTIPWSIIIGGSIAVIGIGAALMLGKR